MTMCMTINEIRKSLEKQKFDEIKSRSGKRYVAMLKKALKGNKNGTR